MLKYILIHPSDNVAVALEDIQEGEEIFCGGQEVRVAESIPAGHKVAVKDIRKGENVIKYGYPIGHATTDIAQGEWVNENVLKTNLEGITQYRYTPLS